MPNENPNSPRRAGWLARLAFGLCGALAVVLAAGSVSQASAGADFALRNFYAAPWTVAAWAMVAALGSVAVVRRVSPRRAPATLALHAALVLILLGALTTHLTAQQGSVRLLRGGPSTTAFIQTDGRVAHFPFTLRLTDCYTTFYPGTTTAMDYVTVVELQAADGVATRHTISMNNILRYGGFRFYQTGIGPDSSTLSVASDVWGIGITYAGYAALLLSCAAFFLERGSRWRGLLRTMKRRALLCASCLALGATAMHAAEPMPATLQRPLAATYGKLYVYYHGRVCPVQTLARDFCTKLCGRDSWRGLTAEQVLTGWLFHYDDWKYERMIRIKSPAVRRRLGIEGEYACLADFYDRRGYKLADAPTALADRGLQEADEKCRLVSLMCTGFLLKIYPYALPDGSGMAWLSWSDRRPAEMSVDDWRFVVGSMEFVAREVQAGRNISAGEALGKIKAWQAATLGEAGRPSALRFGAELWQNALPSLRVPAMVALAVGIGALAMAARRLARADARGTARRRGLTVLVHLLGAALLLYLTFVLALRGIVGGYFPVSNGYETMLCLAWCSVGLALLFARRVEIAMPMGLVVGGLSLLVAMMGEANPPVTPLIPVLSSPWLSVHVVTVMLAYALFAFIAISGLLAIWLHVSLRRRPLRRAEVTERLLLLSRVMLTPAVFSLAAGIFIGAVWAGQSWGRYWGWDAKEVWALITLLVYMLPLHDASLPWLRRTMVAHTWLVLALLTILFNYFGVNYLLSGLHSYAA